MASKKSVNLLPEYLRTEKNAKFLASTIDQFIQTPELERVDGFVGSKVTPNYNPATDVYIREDLPLRKNYQLEPALVLKDSISNITDVVGYDDIINEIGRQGGKTENLDRLFRSNFYSYDPLIDWDKLVNYSEYYWLPTGPTPISIDNSSFSVATAILGQSTYTMQNGYNLSNGMLVIFSTTDSSVIAGREYVVEGVGKSISLVRFDTLEVNESLALAYNETFDSDAFDEFPFDSNKRLPVIPEYITINRSSRDLNPWSRYNRWFHKEVIRISAEINSQTYDLPSSSRALRPIIEFKPNIQLYDFGVTGVANIDLFDNDTVDAISTVHGSPGYYVDGFILEQGQRVVFNADGNPSVRGKIYEVSFTTGANPVLQLTLVESPADLDSVSVNQGREFGGKSLYYNSTLESWVLSQQHTYLNQPPLFTIFDKNGEIFQPSDKINNFTGTKIFGYDIGTGTPDPVLGFPLKYQNSVGVGSFLFKNYFMTDIITRTENNISYEVKTGTGYLKINENTSFSLVNVWKNADAYQIPIVETQVIDQNTTTVIVSSLTRPYTTATVVSFVNNIQTESTLTIGNDLSLTFPSSLKQNDVVLLKIISDATPNENGYYETPLSLTNNPLNNDIADMTLSELSDHLSSMVSRFDDFVGSFPGTSNLRDLDDFAKFGTRLVINSNPIAFAQLFLGKSDHNVVGAIRYNADQYNQFKMNFLKTLITVSDQFTIPEAVDEILKFINKNKDNKSSYYFSDMVPYGTDKTVKEYFVSAALERTYPIGFAYDDSALSFKSLLVYINDVLLGKDVDYTIDSVDETVYLTCDLYAGDSVKIVFYNNTQGSFVPPTPSKLGLYPKYTPEIYIDYSYVSGPVEMIRCHDGSVIKTYGDYRDDIILEFEKRVYNNIKVTYNPEIFDVFATLPGAFRKDLYSREDALTILRKDFIKWAGVYNVDYTSHDVFDDNNPFTWNYKGTLDTLFGESVPGNWKGIFTYFFDTTRPNTHPWEMLGFENEPSWWAGYYGTAPFTSSNTTLWNDLEDGYVRGENVYKTNYKRPGLLSIIPVDASGNLKSPDQFLVSESGYSDKISKWDMGDISPAENTWRRSSYWPFAINVLAALHRPCEYTSVMYDVSRTSLNRSGQLVYAGDLYLNPKNLVIDNIDGNQIAGFGVYVAENGKKNDLNYLSKLKQDISYIDFNLFHKLGGFASKDKIQVIIDSIDPTSTGQGALLPPEDYSLILNVSNPIKTVSISGVIVQKSNGKFVVKGYDKTNPYFEILKPIKSSTSGAVTVGGVSAPFSEWSGIVNNGNSGLTAAELTSAESNTTRYYKQGQIVRYNNRYYRVKIGHTAGTTFDPTLFQLLPSLPTVGGASASLASSFEATVTQIPYGTEYNNVQEVYDLLVGYGAFLESQGFVFDEYNTELFEVLDWKFTGKEFLYWSTQNWADGNLITLSPFANQVRYQFIDSIVDNISGGKYEYSLLKADGKPFPIEKFNLTRDNGICTINSVDTEEGFFFATLNLIQKEHAMVLNNSTIFNDTIYDIESGYRQRRIKISGFRTANWNGDLYSPGFVYDSVGVTDWVQYAEYLPGAVVRFNSSYYESLERIVGDETFDFNKWVKLSEKPIPDLLPNFDYKINQFSDFYSLDIDNFDSDQQELAQHLVGYTKRPYLTNIFTNPITQYKFYQGFIREKGTRNALDKISKAGTFTRKGNVSLTEEWAFRIGHFGGFETLKEIEFSLEEGTSLENPYVVKFTDGLVSNPNPLINYTSSTSLLISPTNFVPSATFNVFDNSTFDESNIDLLTAGYARLDDVTVTAYNKNSLLDIANNSAIQEKDTAWLGFLENGDWTIYRYTRQSSKITGVFVSSPAEAITFVTDFHHGLSVGDVVSVVQFNDQVNGVYIVKEVPELNQFSVASDLSTIVNEDLLSYGSLYKFDKARFNNFEELTSVKNIVQLSAGDKIWIDKAENDKWAVYQKLNNYTNVLSINTFDSPSGQQLGHSIFATDDSPVVMVSAPSWNRAGYDSIGRIWVYEKIDTELEKKYEYILNSNGKIYCNPNTSTSFGYSLNYDIEKELYLVGAPSASNIRAGAGVVVYSTGTGTTRSLSSEGIVKISGKNSLFDDEVTQRVLASPSAYQSEYLRFGNSIYVTQEKSTASTTMLIGAPGDGINNTSTGYVFAYYLNTTTSNTVDITQHPSGINLASTSTITLTSKSRWGDKISGDASGNFIAVSAPGYTSTQVTGLVQIFDKNLNWKQTILSPFGKDVEFGNDVVVSNSGKFLFVSSVDSKTTDEVFGKVAVYTLISETGQYDTANPQIIENPSNSFDLKFGYSISLSKDETVLMVSSLGKNRSTEISFDEDTRSGVTTFDASTTDFIGPIADAGTVHIYNNLGGYFIPAEELTDASVIEGSKYGYSVAATNNSVFVGAPWTTGTSDPDDSTFYQFNKIDSTTNSWNLLRVQPDLVDTRTIRRVALIDSNKEEIIEYLDVIDPLKGRIAGVADQEIKFKIASDPAVYSIGRFGTVNDPESNWIDDHVGELWWDLSTAKYVWYEQGDEIFRKNNWGGLFPGATIDVYEWVKSALLPSEWAAQADTNEGLTNGISGQPKYPDNSVISVKQVWNTVTNGFENVYYFWVKNKVTVPDVKSRRISCFQVASLIADPVANGVKFVEILSPDSVAFANVQPSLVGNYINANISIDSANNDIPRHTEWLLLEEGSDTSMPNTLLNKKLFDSLLGHDAVGNIVPDLSLSPRSRYGIGIRPQQTLFKDRLEALRNLVEFSNSVLIQNRITGNYSFKNLNKAEEIPEESLREYDLIVEDVQDLENIDTSDFSRAEIECFTFNGKVISANVIAPGFGYTLPPAVEIVSATGSGAIILTEIDSLGRVVSATVESAGSNYTELSPETSIRPYTVIVRANSDYGNRWTKHYFDYQYRTWVRVKNQTYNTPLFWEYVDWQSDTYNGYKDYLYVLDDTYEVLSVTDAVAGDYIKIRNGGDGRYIILEKTAEGDLGNFSSGYNIVYSENGTIQILDTIWDYSTTNYSYDAATLEETLYDQLPDLELFYILTALKDDIFVKDLKVNWNLFFFKAVRYALTEQKLLDWAFKTSFVTVRNQIGELDQRSVYKLDNEKYFEDYIKEIKPYRTKIRSYTSLYNSLDDGQVFVTDFDLPSYYNSSTESFEVVRLGNTLLEEQPRKSWYDNYKYYVKEVLVANPGSGYSQRPTVVFTTASGDTGSGAKGEAYIKAGRVSKILITDPGSNYVIPPTVSLVGGGSVVSTATMSVVLDNDYIRKNKIGIKFDRVSVDAEVGPATITETFVCPGNQQEFILGWLAKPEKTKIVPLLDGQLVFAADYTIEYYTERYLNYTKKFCKFVFLNNVPTQGQIFKITYDKNINLYTAIDRIHNYYQPTDSMPGVELPLLMSGAERGSNTLQGLSFGYSTPWGQGFYDNNSAWSDLTDYYASSLIVRDISVGTSTIKLNSVDGVAVGHQVLISNTSTKVLRQDTVVKAVNTLTNTITIEDYRYPLKRIWSDSTSTTGTVVFYTDNNFGGDIKVGDLATVYGIDNPTLSGFNGSWYVTGVGNDRFTAVGTGSQATVFLSTTSARTLGSTASVHIPFVLNNVIATSTYKIYTYKDVVRNTSTLFYDTLFPIEQVSTATVFLAGTGYLPNVITGAEYFLSTVTTSGTLGLNIKLNSSVNDLTIDVYGYPLIEFWKDNFNVGGVDTELSAGSWDSTGNFVGALGVDPADLTLKGGALLEVEHGYAPEEHVKGQVFDTLGISVFTGEDSTSPLVVNGVIPLVKNQVAIKQLPYPVEESANIMVSSSGQIFERLYSPPDIADVGPYFSSAPAVPIGPVGDAIASTAGDDTYTGPYALNMDWNMFGTVFTEIYVGTNGYITFGGGDSEWTPLNINALEHPAIFVMYCDLWQDVGEGGQPLQGGVTPGLFMSSGTIGDFQYWKLRFQGSHYDNRNDSTLPVYEYEVGLYSNGVDQYVEMIFENTWRGTADLTGEAGFVTGIATENGGQSIEKSWTEIGNNTSHVFYSTSEGGNWKYAGQGSFDPYKQPYIFTGVRQYFTVGDTIYVAPQPDDGRASYSIMSVAGDNILGSNSIVVSISEDNTAALIPSAFYIGDTRSVYVTMDGVEVPPSPSEGTYGYKLVSSGEDNNRAGVIIYDLPLGNRTLQAWFFKENYPGFNGVWREEFEIDPGDISWNLSIPLPNIEPISSQLIVEYEPLDTPGLIGKQRLYPPDVRYYKYTGDSLVFEIDRVERNPDTFSSSNLKVYANGELLRPGFDYTINSNNTITIAEDLLAVNDVVAIENLFEYEYVILDNRLILRDVWQQGAGTLTVTSFRDHDGMTLRSERFAWNGFGRYVLSLPAVSSDFMWVYVNGRPLAYGYDYELLEDRRTVQFSEWVALGPELSQFAGWLNINGQSEVMITVVNSPLIPNVTLGYKIFKDIFDRSHYTRLAEFYTTRLTKELVLEDTEIHVEDSSKLIPPNPIKNIPGVVYIDGERIEFFEKRDNTLSNLRRSTLGTAPATYSEIGTKLIDQSSQQKVPYTDVIKRQKHITSSTTGAYVLNTVTNTYNTYTFIISTATYTVSTGTIWESGGDGITLVTDADPTNQLYVRYGGRPLRKNDIQVHDSTKAYDTTSTSLVTIPAEFSVIYNSSQNRFELNLNIADFTPGVRIDIEQRTGVIWQGSESLLVADTPQAEFLRQKTSALPDVYYYGGDPTLVDDTNFELTDDDDTPIEGY